MTLPIALLPQSQPTAITETPSLQVAEPSQAQEKMPENFITTLEISLFDRKIAEADLFTPSDFLQPIFQDMPPLKRIEAAICICDYISECTTESSQDIQSVLSNSYTQSEADFSAHTIQFLESIQILPDSDTSMSAKIAQAYGTYKKFLHDLSHANAQLKFVMTDLTILPLSIGQATSLQKLHLWCNYLTFLPDSITALINLTTLSLNINNFGHFPPVILNLQNLTTLNFSKNGVTSLPNHFGNLENLVTLDLSDNELTDLPDSFCHLTKLKQLLLNDNKLQSLPPRFGSLTTLAKLVLFGNHIMILPESLCDLSELESLDLSCNKLALLPNNLNKLHTLHTLMLNHNHLLDFDPAILSLPALKILHLYNQNEDNQLRLAKRLLQKYGDVFVGKYTQNPIPLDEEHYTSYFESVD